MSRSTEFTLSLIATIFLTIGWIIVGLITIYAGFAPVDEMDYTLFTYLVIYSVLTIPLLVLIWVGTFKIKRDSRGWGIFILVMGVLYTFSVYFIPGTLLLISGIMMVAKKDKSQNIAV
ncbi:MULTISPECIES: DUF4064 domain-containing protein [unclassified Bacillus (in: firmicutes)]|uniref:DUF4064 domain-containing protein n=1 Tax=unclassified Bacillus (in: firmicutes) TaxID=185979 RepID=UPI001BE8219C|nr:MULTISPECIES: DUF4064 domain-containing protein [unclassified Bacillus (in: firmicutes)]MBT2615088.1 DUF4064 domain-containing protein [Bacillus sp. ISL-78]MBT2627705.1 DUF4064 domain-containing protein [Bacillus sp. ISL-101]MBT2716902.1 DUF4064 domain-containing protein [Bacillus sp. ISL-57]